MRMTWKTALIRHKNRFRLRSYDARAWCRIQEIPSARIGGANGFPRSHQQIRLEHSEQYGTVTRIIHSLLKQARDTALRHKTQPQKPQKPFCAFVFLIEPLWSFPVLLGKAASEPVQV